MLCPRGGERTTALTSLIQYGAQSSSQCNKAREYNKRHVDQEEETKSPHTEKYVEHVKEAIRTLKKPQEPYNKEANLTALQGT